MLKIKIGKKILICSQGSIGKMYTDLLIKNWPNIRLGLHTSRKEVDIFRNEKFEFINSSLDECINWKPDAAIICNPAIMHIDFSIKLLEANIPVLIEKPIGVGEEGFEKYKRIKELSINCIALVGYVLRYEQGYKIIKDILLRNKLGKISEAKFLCSSWLPSWRPDVDYRTSVSAKKKLGGGVLLELSHELDLALSLLGSINLFFSHLNNSGKLEIDVEDYALLKGRSDKCENIIFELDFCSNENKRIINIRGTLGEAFWDIKNGFLKVEFLNKEKILYEFKEVKSQKYLVQIQHFFDCIENDIKPKCEIKDGLLVIDLIKNAKKLSNNKKL